MKVRFLISLLLLTRFLFSQQNEEFVELWGVNVLKTHFSKQEAKEWETFFDNNRLIYKQYLAEGLPLAFVLKTDVNEYLFKTDRGNYPNMGERFELVYKYLVEKFGSPQIVETAEGGYLRDAYIKQKPDGSVYFLVPDWDWENNRPMKDRGEELDPHGVYRKITFYKDYVYCEWTPQDTPGLVIKLKWQSSGITVTVQNFSESLSKK
jgi:hypothetical protein